MEEQQRHLVSLARKPAVFLIDAIPTARQFTTKWDSPLSLRFKSHVFGKKHAKDLSKKTL